MGRPAQRCAACLLLVVMCLLSVALAGVDKSKSSRALRTNKKKNRLKTRYRDLTTESSAPSLSLETSPAALVPSDVVVSQSNNINKAAASSIQQIASRDLRKRRGPRNMGQNCNGNSRFGRGGPGRSFGKGKGKGKGRGRPGKGHRGEGGNGGGGKGRKGKGKGDSVTEEENDFCGDLSFFPDTVFNEHDGGSGKGGGKSGKGGRSRALQFGDGFPSSTLAPTSGEGCEINVLDTARENPDLSNFVDLVEHAGLEQIFTCAGPFTALVPSNAAFNENPELLTSFFNPRNLQAVQEMLLFHILPGMYLEVDFEQGSWTTLLGADANVEVNPLMFNQALVSESDILACNGVIHILDDVLIPPGSPILPTVCEILDFRVPGEFPAAARFTTLLHRGLWRFLDLSTSSQRVSTWSVTVNAICSSKESVVMSIF